MKYGLGKIEITFDIPKEIKNDKEMYEYTRKIAEELAKSDVFKHCEKPMLIPDIETSKEPFLDNNEYYIDYYDAIIPK